MSKNIKIVGSLCAILLLGSAVAVSASITPRASAPQVQANKMTRGTWVATVDKVEFTVNPANATRKAVNVKLIITNPTGKDVDVAPTGVITGVTGSSGKVYSGWDESVKLDAQVEGTEQMRKDVGKIDENKAYEAGVYRLGYMFPVDVAETSIVSVTYKDDNGISVEIPVNVKPTTKTMSTTGK